MQTLARPWQASWECLLLYCVCRSLWADRLDLLLLACVLVLFCDLMNAEEVDKDPKTSNPREMESENSQV
jgi:hypothetical protein